MTFARLSHRRLIGGVVAALAAALVTPVLVGAPAQADTVPVAPEIATVSADALPTVQINGVVWAQVVVGNKVYATGKFTQARPAGSAAGTNETARSNILAFDITTGALDTTFAPTLNAQGLAIKASSDGKRIFVAGDFTSVNGTTRNRIAALDATTGALVSGFNASLGSQGRALAVLGNTLYVGGGFGTAGGASRSRLAAFDATSGALLSWNPGADQEVLSLTALSGKVVVGGKMTTLAGAAVRGMGAVDAATGASLPWAIGSVVYDYGKDAGIWSLTNDGTRVYGTGYNFLVNNDPTTAGNFESVFAAEADGGALVWVSGCRGDTYDAVALNGVVYNAGHAHNCEMVGGNPETSVRSYQRAIAFSAAPGANGRVNVGGDFNGRPAPDYLHWLPTVPQGTYTGQYQGGWSITGNSTYVVMGGEFPSINGTAQQGLVRFAVKDTAPNKEGPQGYSELKPTATSIATGTLRLSWQAAWDRDNKRLTYELLRGATVGSSTVVATRTQDATWWARPQMALTDRTATPGSSQTYRVRVKDPLGNTLTSAATTVTVPSGTATPSPYADAVSADAPSSYWRLGEASGSTAYDWAAGNDVTLASDATRGVTGALKGDTDKATGFSGAASVPGVTAASVSGPQTFSVEAWFSTTSTSGGKVVGFGNNKTSNSSNYDRHVYLTNDGKVVFGVYNSNTFTLSSGAGLNDGKWHHVVATMGSDGMNLYVDGVKAASRTDNTTAQAFTGYWRIGGDTLNGWPSQPTSAALAGSIDDVAVYPTVLSADRVTAHYAAATGANQPPTASFTSTATNLSVAFNGSGSTDGDGSIASYAWDFGDSSTGTGVSPTHVYSAAGTYTVKLTVTDDDGATNETTRSVTVTAAPAPTTLAADTFGRTTTNGWGSADTGGAWTTSNATSNFAVGSGVGTIRMGSAGSGPAIALGSVSSSASDTTVTVSTDKAATGNGIYLNVIGRRTSGGDYTGRVRVLSNNSVAIGATRIVSGTETLLGSELTLSGVTYAANTQLKVRLQVEGTGTTTLRLKVWLASGTEPASWQVTRTDTTSGLQTTGSVALRTYLSGSATNAPIVARFDDLTVRAL